MLNKIGIKIKFIFVFAFVFLGFIVLGMLSNAFLKDVGERTDYSYENNILSFMSVFEMNRIFSEMTVIAYEIQLTDEPDKLEALQSEFVGNADVLLNEVRLFQNKLRVLNAAEDVEIVSSATVEEDTPELQADTASAATGEEAVSAPEATEADVVSAATEEADAVSSSTPTFNEYYYEAESILNKTKSFSNIIPLMVIAARDGDTTSLEECNKRITPLINDMTTSMKKLVDYSGHNVLSSNEYIHNVINNSSLMLIAVSVITVLLGVFAAYFVIRSVTLPISKLIICAKSISDGDLNINLDTRGTDEISVLSNAFKHIVEVIDTLINDISHMSSEHKLGETDSKIDTDKYMNSYKAIAVGLNDMVNEYVNESMIIAEAVHYLSVGDFTRLIKDFPGKKAVASESVNALKDKLSRLNTDINTLSERANMGDLKKRIDEAEYDGDWVKLVSGLNLLVNRVAEPVIETGIVLSEHARGNFSARVTGDYKGEFLNLKNSINSSTQAIYSYIEEIARTLKNLESNDLNQEITREYMGDFDIIKGALNNIFIKLNDFMRDVGVSSSQVKSSASQMLQAGVALSDGAASQAGAVNELTEIVDNISKMAGENEKNAMRAEGMSKETAVKAKAGSEEMKEMLVAMKNINEASDNIRNVIKTIEDIAMQTNLLALNASVEAARAGVHGKGFAVVAEEVRTLAGRSALAVKESSELITDTINRVAMGEKIAGSTARSLQTIVEEIDIVSGFVSKISESSSEQTNALSEINDKLQQINCVVQNTSATAEETAASATELTEQSHKLNEMLSIFTLKGC